MKPEAADGGVKDKARTEVIGWGAAKDGVDGAQSSGPLDLATFGAAHELEVSFLPRFSCPFLISWHVESG